MSDSLRPGERVLAIDLRSSKFGYVVFEGFDLIDRGIRHFRRSTKILRKRILPILETFPPDRVIVRTPAHRASGRAVQTIKAELHSLKIRSMYVRGKDVRKLYVRFGARNKQDIAMLITKRFPEFRLPTLPIRKAWQAEPTKAVLIDAAATAVFFLGIGMLSSSETKPPNLSVS